MLLLYVFQQYHEINATDDARHTRHVQVSSLHTHSHTPRHNRARVLRTQHSPCFARPCASGTSTFCGISTAIRSTTRTATVDVHAHEDMQTSVMWLYDNHPQDKQQFLLDLNELLYNNSFDWKDYVSAHDT